VAEFNLADHCLPNVIGNAGGARLSLNPGLLNNCYVGCSSKPMINFTAFH